MKKKTNKAFSLIELMFALVAISVMLAVSMPAITTKYAKENPIVSNSGTLLTSQDCDINFTNNFNLECTLCYGEEACAACGGNCPPNMKKIWKNVLASKEEA